MKADIVTTWTPSFALVTPATLRGERWLTRNCPDLTDGAVDHRCLAEIVHGAVADRLRVQDSESGRFARED